MASFDIAFRRTLNWETGGDWLNGGLNEHPNDPGGLTKWGIAQRYHPDLDVRSLTLDDARGIYYRDYWQKIQGCKIECQRFANEFFDFVVMSGKAIEVTQAMLKVAQDGVVGPKTLKAINTGSHNAEALKKVRLAYYQGLKGWKHFGRGWKRRVLAP